MNGPLRTFDTLQYAKKLQKAGVSSEQAEVHAEAVKSIIDDKLATKADLFAVKSELKTEIAGVKTEITEVKTEMKHLEERLINRIEKSKYVTIISLGGIMMAGIGILETLIRLV